MPVSRREFFAAPALIGLWRKTDRKITGGFVNDSFPLGHRLRDRAAFRAPTQQLRVPIVIVGGGMAGLNAAWHLDKRGFRDFVLLEMERQAGGNSRWGENEISKFPWAAHYVPVPAKGESLARELFEELGVFRDGKWDERALCFDPQERLFINGHWQEGIEPEDGATPRDREQYRRFVEKINEFRGTGQFTVPMERGAKASPLDRMSMADWLAQAGLRFGAAALVHQLCLPRRLRGSGERYVGVGRRAIFCVARTGREGSADLARRQRLDRRAIDRKAEAIFADRASWCIGLRETATKSAFSPSRPSISRTPSIWAAPTFLASYIVEGAPRAEGFQYSPWLTANLTLDRIPGQKNAEPAWDNVIYDSPDARLCQRDAHESGDAYRSNGVDVLLVAGRAHARRRAPIVAREGLELLERGDPERPGARPSRHPAVRGAHGHHAHRPRHGAARRPGSCFRKKESDG